MSEQRGPTPDAQRGHSERGADDREISTERAVQLLLADGFEVSQVADMLGLHPDLVAEAAR